MSFPEKNLNDKTGKAMAETKGRKKADEVHGSVGSSSNGRNARSE